MQRLSVEILKNMFQSKLTRCEIIFLLCVSRYQDQGGHVRGAYYKEIAGEMHSSYPQFYAAMKSLEAKGFIRCEKNSYYDYDITILGNDYRQDAIGQDARENLKRRPYINTRHEIFYSHAFLKMKPGAQLLAMEFMGVTRLNKGTYKIRIEKFFSKYQEALGVTKRTLRVYLTQLRQFFSIGIKGGLYWIRPKVEVYRDGGNTEIDNYNEQQIRTECRRNRIKIEDEKETKEVRKLFRQYGRQAAAAGKDILEIVLEGIRRSIDPFEKLAANKPVLKNRLVHKWVRLLLGIEEGAGKEQKAGKASLPRGKDKFHNFHQRDYDFEALEKALLNAE